MADILDVETAIVSTISGILYPNGVGQPSLTTTPVKVYPGWPEKNDLIADLAPGAGLTLHITVFPQPSERVTTRYPSQVIDTSSNAKTYTLTAGSNTITIGGVAPGSSYIQNLCAFVNGKAYIAQSTGSESASTLAAALAAAILADVPGTTVLGAVITLPSSARLGPLRVGSGGSSAMEVGRQEKRFNISVWADSPINRSILSKAFSPALRNMQFIAAADTSSIWLKYGGSQDNDSDQKYGIYRRDIMFTVEYADVLVQSGTEIVAFTENLRDNLNNLINSVTE